MKEYVIDSLPGKGRRTYEGAMTGIWIAGESGKVCDNSCSQGVEMNITDELGEIGIFLTENGLIAILKKLAVPAVSFVEGHRMTGEKTGHHLMEGNRTGLKEQMSVIGEKRPCIAGGMGVSDCLSHSFDKTVFVNIVTENQPFFDSTDDDVVECSFGIEAGMTGHGQSYQTGAGCVNSYLLAYGRPLRVPLRASPTCPLTGVPYVSPYGRPLRVPLRASPTCPRVKG